MLSPSFFMFSVILKEGFCDAGGSAWGEEGFLKLPRGMPGNGSLGLAANPGYPVKISANPHHHAEEMSTLENLFSGLGQLLGRRSLE